MEAAAQFVLRSLGVQGHVSTQRLQEILSSAGLQATPTLGMPSIESPRRQCSKCSQPLKAKTGEQVQAAILCLDGWRLFQHVPLRCWYQGCAFKEKRVWYNYIALGKTHHQWCWHEEDRLEYLFIYSSWGVSAEWLRHFTQRAAFQHLSFQSESCVCLGQSDEMQHTACC